MPKLKKANINWRMYFLSLEITVLGESRKRIESQTGTIGYHMGNVSLICKAEDYIDVYVN